MIVAAGLGVWALGLQSDLDDQKGQTAQAQQDAEQASSQVSALQGQLDQISQGVSDASDQLAHAGEDAQQHARDALTGLQERLADLREQIQQGLRMPRTSPTRAAMTANRTPPGRAPRARRRRTPRRDRPEARTPGAGGTADAPHVHGDAPPQLTH